MYANLPISAYYPKNDSKFIDPMYVPYMDKSLLISKNSKCKTPVNTWPKSGCKHPDIHPDTIRIGWNMDFQRLHPQDKCPAGWKDSGKNDGLCVRVHQGGHESNFFTSSEFAVKYQYFDGYTVSPKDKEKVDYLNSLDPHPELQQRSVNPFTGKYVVYFDPPANSISEKYGRAPVKHSYLGNP